MLSRIRKNELGRKPARIPPQTPPAGGTEAEAGRIHSPRQMFRPAESVLVLLEKGKDIFLWCPPRLCEAVAGLIHSSSFRSKKVRAKCIITAQINEHDNKLSCDRDSKAGA